MVGFFSVDAHQLLALLSFIVIAITWMCINSTLRAERKEMSDWCQALFTCLRDRKCSYFPRSICEKGVYKRVKMLEKFGIDADVSDDKEFLYVSYRGQHHTLYIH